MQQRELLNRPLRIFPIPVRVDVRAEFALGGEAPIVKQSFSHVTSHLENENTYWTSVSVPYISYFAFDEIPAAFAGEDHSTALLEPAARLTSYLTGQQVRHELWIPEDERRTILDDFKRRRSPRKNR
jgi:hypothetical protein